MLSTLYASLRLSLGLLTALLLTFSLPIHASVNILPQGADPRDPDDRGWFLYQVEPGEEVEDAVVLTNSSNEDLLVQLKGRDAEITAEGAFTVISSQLQNQNAGRWIEIEAEEYTVPASSSITVPFTVNVPASTPSGEYGAGLAVQQLGTSGDRQAGNVTIKTRSAVRMYVTVGSDLTLTGNVNDLNIIDPEDEDFALERRKRSTLGRENLIVQFLAQNTGNVYGSLQGDYEVRFPSGEVYTGELNRDLATNVPAKDFYIDTRLPYEVGTTTATVNYEITPLNASEVAGENLTGTLTDEVTLTQEQIDNFAPARSPIQVTDGPVSSGSITDAPAVVEPEPESEEQDYTQLLITVAVVLLAAILVLQVVNLVRKK